MDIIKELDELHFAFQDAANAIGNHGWSRQITRYDSDFVNLLSKRMQEYSNRLYQVREELKNVMGWQI